ncbi:sulfate transport system permease protein [Luteimonas sp. J16]|jgi:sulfate transport system permease protein|uniref:sulfate ABC transporter permease subunit CysW n=1 Tax=unclassified Luteimonas TaxID=2629088 RepID=UPI0004AF267F|nr:MULTISPECIES: sulfate ABC transporter permease subunit CysW [unclassified Luteimonas]TWG91651.1 sulfate transport system permease protein [Luteimonas sp. J16]
MADAHAGHGLETPAWLRRLLIGAAVLVMGLLVVLPLLMVLLSAFGKGFATWWNALTTPDAIAALKLTLFTAAIVIPVNAVFGVFAAWSLTRFEFRGKRALLALVDLPFAVSPVVAGLCLVLLFGSQGWFADILREHEVKILFARPGIVLATLFITFPFVVRELVPLMQQQGSEEEVVARSLGANAWTMFFRVTLPNIKWGLLYGVLLCGARAMGEFGAVSVVSGHIRGLTNTLPLHIEILYNEFDSTGAFAVSSLLAGLALVTLVLKFWLESRHSDGLASHRRHA